MKRLLIFMWAEVCLHPFLSNSSQMGIGKGEVRCFSRSGGSLYLETTMFVLPDAEGSDICYACVSSDISKRKNIENELMKSQTIFAKAQKAAHLGNWNWDVSSNVMWWSRESVRIFGSPSVSALATFEGFLSFVHTEERGMVEKSIRESLLTTKTCTVEFRAETKDQSIRSLFLQGTVENNEPGSEKILGIILDITERKQAEKALEEGSEMVNLLLDSTEEAICGLDLEGRCTFINSSFLEMLNFLSNTELIGKKICDIIHSDRGHCTNEGVGCSIYQTIIDGRRIHRKHAVFTKGNGELMPVEYWSHPVMKDGMIVGSVITFMDITEKLLVENQIKLHEKKMIQADKMNSLGIMVSGVAHEINNPNNFIMLNSDCKVKEKVPELLQDIKEGSERIQYIVKKLKDFSRRESSSYTQEVNVNKAVHSAIDLTESLIKKTTSKPMRVIHSQIVMQVLLFQPTIVVRKSSSI